jgi:hypothetical protein
MANFITDGVYGSVYYRSKRAADLVNTPRFHLNPYQPLYTPIGYGCLDTIASSSDSPEARELYSCFQPLTPEEIEVKDNNAWKHAYVQQGYSVIFPVRLPDPAVDRQRIKAFLDQRGVSVELMVDRPAAIEPSPAPLAASVPVSVDKPVASPEPVEQVKPVTPPEPVSPVKPVTPPEPVSPVKPVTPPEPVCLPEPVSTAKPVTVPVSVTCSVSRPPTHRFSTTVPSTLTSGMLVYRPFTPAERRQHEMHMAAALAYITRIRQPFPPQKRARK